MSRTSRRTFLRQAAAVPFAFPAIRLIDPLGPRSANEKLNIGVIGTAHRAAENINGVQGENIVAVCDIDDRYLDDVAKRFTGATKYNDFRKLLDHPKLDAVVVSTADHVHAPASVQAMRRGMHCYCEKPLAHNVHEARLVAETARANKVATQMGTQIHAGDNYRRVVELVQSGAIGPVREVHVWCGKTWSQGERPKDTPPVPEYLHWDLWLGPAPERPYHPTYLPANWRRWWDFGSGTLGDMACHYMDLPFWALKLKSPTRVQSQGPPVHPETTPLWLIVQYDFPDRGPGMPACKLTWYDHDRKPPQLAEKNLPRWNDGVLFIGDGGMLMADYGRRKLYPEEKFADFKAPEPTIPNSIGHYAEWIKACKEGTPTTCSFDYSGLLTESVLLGNAAFRAGQALDWDGKMLKATNCPGADKYLKREYRKGWEL